MAMKQSRIDVGGAQGRHTHRCSNDISGALTFSLPFEEEAEPEPASQLAGRVSRVLHLLRFIAIVALAFTAAAAIAWISTKGPK